MKKRLSLKTRMKVLIENNEKSFRYHVFIDIDTDKIDDIQELL